MKKDPPWHRIIVFYAPEDALGLWTHKILSRLGYRFILPERFARLCADDPGFKADMMLVDERRMEEVIDPKEKGKANGEEPSLPIVLLTGKHGAAETDSRVVGAIKRPAGLHDLYRLMQQVFEDTPRTTPRVSTQLRVRCELGERNWNGRVLSLSENGCLMRSSEAITLGQRVRIEFELPETGSIRIDAEAAYQLLPDIGLVFSSVAPGHRQTLERFVTEQLLSA